MTWGTIKPTKPIIPLTETIAPIISTIQDRGYVEQREKKFHSTDLGDVVTDKLDDNLFLSSRNLSDVLVLETREVDPVSLVRFNHVLLTKGALAQFEEMLG